MDKIVVDVIIPVYKTEKYLEECLESVFAQDYPDIHIVLVDDGSPDACPGMCDAYAEKYPDISVVHQTNRGLGLSRNSGMAASDGTYICFLDSDDKLDGSHAISALVERAEEKHADITVGSFRRFHEGYVSEPNYHHLSEGSYTRSVDFRFKGFFMYGHLTYNWGKIYRRDFLEKYDLKCRAYPFTQDKAHNMACCAYEPVYAFIEESVYQYRVNESSVTFKYKENLLAVWVAIAADFHDFLKERKIKKKYGDLIAFHIFAGCFFLIKQELQQKKGIRGIILAAKMLKAYGKIPMVRSAMSALAKGKFLRRIDVWTWKIVIRLAAILFSLHGYLLYAAGTALLQGLHVDEQVSRSRYSRQ